MDIAIFVALMLAAISNLCWYFAFKKREETNLEAMKLLASRTLSEYAWLKKAENPQPPKPQPNQEGYETAWENDDDG